MITLDPMVSRGFWRAFSWRDMPVKLHWTLPIGMLLFGGLRFVPAFWLAFIVVLLVHELGHALVALRYGHRVVAIEITGFGGVCRWSGNATRDEVGAIAWGGVAAQAVLAAATHLVVTMVGPVESALGLQLLRGFISVNIALIAINLIPIAPLDGAEAWAWVGRVLKRLRGQSALRQHVDVDAMLGVIEAPPIEPPRDSTPTLSELPLASPPAPAVERSARCSSDAELAELLKSIADEAAELHRRGPMP